MLNILISLLAALFPPPPGLNPFPRMDVNNCAPVAEYYGARVNPWLGERWQDSPTEFTPHQRRDFRDMGGVWEFRVGMELHILHFSKYVLTPPNPNGGYPYTWGYHDVCYVIRQMHPLEAAWDNMKAAFWDGYRRVLLNCYLRGCSHRAA